MYTQHILKRVLSASTVPLNHYTSNPEAKTNLSPSLLPSLVLLWGVSVGEMKTLLEYGASTTGNRLALPSELWGLSVCAQTQFTSLWSGFKETWGRTIYKEP